MKTQEQRQESSQQSQSNSSNSQYTFNSNSASGQGTPSRIQDVFTMVVSGRMRAAKDAAHQLAETARQHQDNQTAQWAGKIWTIANAFIEIQQMVVSESMTGLKEKASLIGDVTRALIGAQALDADAAERVIQAAGGYWTMANEASKAAATSSNGSGDSAAKRASNSETIEQHRLPTSRGWAYCGIATSMMLLHANGKGNPDQRQAEMNELVSEMYISGSGSSVTEMAKSMRKRGLDKATATTSGTFSQLIQTLDSGQPVPFGIAHVKGTVVKMNQSVSSKYNSHLKAGDPYERGFGASGHWVLVVGYEGSPENPTHFIYNDPDLGGQLKSNKADFERMGVGNGQFFQVYQ